MTFQLWIPFVALALVVVAYMAYSRTTPGISGKLRVLLTALRTAAFLCLVTILLDPRCVRTIDREEPAKVIVMIDRSASMSLPAGTWEDRDSPSRFDAARALSSSLASAVDGTGCELETVYFSSKLSYAAGDTVRPDEQGTDIAGSLQDVSRGYEGEHVTAVVVFSDGIDTEERLVRRQLPDIPVFTVGLGDTTPPEDVRIGDVDYNSVVRVPSNSSIKASVSYTGSREKHAVLRLAEGERVIFEKELVFSPVKKEIVCDIPVTYREAGRRRFDLSVEVDGYDAENDNNRRDIVVEAEKAKAKILVVDLRPGWELHFMTALLREGEAYDFDVFTLPGREAAPSGGIRPPDTFLANLGECDAVVLGSVNENFLDGAVTAGLKRFVRERGGGLLILPGNGSLFETPGAWNRLGDLLPAGGSPPFRWNLQYTSVIPGAQASSNPVTTHLLPLLSQTEWQERSPLLGYYSGVTPGAAGDALLNVVGRSTPALMYGTSGKGRVAVVSAGPLWRWKFLSDNNTVYDEIVSRLLDVLSRGEETDRFVVTVKKNVFDAGENPVVYAELFNEKMQPVTGAPVRMEVSYLDDDSRETPLDQIAMRRDAAHNTRFEASVPPLPPGRYLVRGHADVNGRSITSQAHEIRISRISVEFRRVRQDLTRLASIALRTGGRYGYASVDGFASRMNLEPRNTRTISERIYRTSTLVFLVVLALLGTEWMLRKRAGMI